MYSFEGQFRRLPEQNLAGASRKQERDELLQKAHFDRKKREDDRKRLVCAVQLQAAIRSFIARQKVKAILRSEFDQAVKQSERQSVDLNALGQLSTRLLFFYKAEVDNHRLIWLAKHLLKLSPAVNVSSCQNKSSPWRWRLKRLLFLNLQLLKIDIESVAAPLRVLEVFTSEVNDSSVSKETSTQHLVEILEFLVSRGFFGRLKEFLDAKTPPLLNVSPSPPTPLAGCLFDLVVKPIALSSNSVNQKFSNLVYEEFANNFFVHPLSEPVKMFFLPAFSSWSGFPHQQFLQFIRTSENISYSSNLLYSVLALTEQCMAENVSWEILSEHLQVLALLSCNITKLHGLRKSNTEDNEDSSSDEEADIENAYRNKHEAQLLRECSALINNPNRVNYLLQAVEHCDDSHVMQSLCKLCHNLLISQKQAVHQYKILYLLALQPSFLAKLWNAILSVRQATLFGNSSSLLSDLSFGIMLTPTDADRIVPLLATFCALFSLLNATLHDGEFYNDDQQQPSGLMPFSLSSLVQMTLILRDVTLGLVELAYPETRPSVRDQYRFEGFSSSSSTFESVDTVVWAHLFKVCVALLRNLNARDLRRQFCPDNHWVSSNISLHQFEKPTTLSMHRRGRLRALYRPFMERPSLTREELEEGPPPSTKEIRVMTILKELPFTIPFQERVVVFQNMVYKDKMIHRGLSSHFFDGSEIRIGVRRNYLYEDAFEKLSLENEPDLRNVMRVQLTSTIGVDEVGIDGGGLFREFLAELLKTAFDPNRGFFRLTTDNLLYPNPNVHLLHQNFQPHYFFIGRMLGKAMYENLLVELPLAEFFLSKITGRNCDVDFHNLASLDPVIYRNLLYLKTYDGDVADLGLDFTVMTNDFGECKVNELKPGGSNIPVTNANRIEYIHQMADYKLNKQIRAQVSAFKQGLANVIPLDWLYMFNSKELQVLISGAEVPVDLADLKSHTYYSGGFSDKHPTIDLFWRVMEDFSEVQKKQVLKFVTSCSRPPLLGFKELDPPFCIQLAGSSVDRLPTSSTCMNLLKLPEFTDYQSLKDKLLYAIQSGAGFELS
ncbi:ubiquitin-protein ligase E3C-like isoform X2 [Bemisia tabaci]|uniref:ubiquitin-protein ligase E3C isoform X2 n=1 Tax=Bemisia tabaci TaxID=7038 RepID=UPI003B2863F2